MLLLCLFFVFSVGEGMGEGDLVVMLGALSVAREGRVPLLLVLLAVFALAYVDVAAKIALDRAVAVVGPGDSDATAITLVGLEALVQALEGPLRLGREERLVVVRYGIVLRHDACASVGSRRTQCTALALSSQWVFASRAPEFDQARYSPDARTLCLIDLYFNPT